jgi:hypothetical protein
VIAYLNEIVITSVASDLLFQGPAESRFLATLVMTISAAPDIFA